MMNPIEFASLAHATAITIAQNKTSAELGLIAAFLTQVGDTIATIAAQLSLIEEATEGENDED